MLCPRQQDQSNPWKETKQHKVHYGPLLEINSQQCIALSLGSDAEHWQAFLGSFSWYLPRSRVPDLRVALLSWDRSAAMLGLVRRRVIFSNEQCQREEKGEKEGKAERRQGEGRGGGGERARDKEGGCPT